MEGSRFFEQQKFQGQMVETEPVLSLDMQAKLEEIHSLPSEMRKQRYRSWGDAPVDEVAQPNREYNTSLFDKISFVFDKVEKPNEKIDDKQAKNLLEGALHKSDSVDIRDVAATLVEWMQEDRKTRGDYIQKICAEFIEDGGVFDFQLVFLLSEVSHTQGMRFLSSDLAFALERTSALKRGIMSPELQDQLAILHRLNDQKSNNTFHKVLDFFCEFRLTINNDPERLNQLEDELGGGYDGLSQELTLFLEKEKDFAQNYLVDKHIAEVVESSNMYNNAEKLGALAGVSGGNKDDVIYAYAHLRENYQTRLSLGIREGYVLANPVLPLAPGYLGYYKAGKIEKVFLWQDINEDDQETKEQEYISKNDLDDEYIYDELNEPDIRGSRFQHASNKLEKLRPFWDFKKHLQSVDRNFYFDLTQIDTQELHPLVLGMLLDFNSQWIVREEGATNDIPNVSLEEYYQNLFPLGNGDDAQQYSYEYFSSLSVRQKIVDDFGFDLSELSLWEQRNFLAFLEKTSLDEVHYVQDFVKRFGVPGIRTCLSMETDEKLLQHIIVASKNEHASEVEQVLADYDRVVDFALKFGQSVIRELSQLFDTQVNEKRFLKDMLFRATEFLRVAFSQKPGELQYDTLLQNLQTQHRALSVQDCMQGVVSRAVIDMVNLVGDSNARQVLNTVFSNTQSDDIRSHIRLAFDIVTPHTENAEAIRDLQDFYNTQIQFEAYTINEKMNAVEVAFLKDEINTNSTTLDLGCGTGRLLGPLAEDGQNIFGLDFSDRHVHLVQEQYPKVLVVQGNWKKTGFQDNSFDTVYSLGRSILHESTVQGQEALFAEVTRVLRLGGKFIFDIPNREKGAYRALSDQYASVMKERGITNFRYGTIYDSPDHIHFDTRYVYGYEDILRLAEDNGFVVERVEKKQLPTGAGDENIYYILRKVEAVAQEEEGALAA